MKPSERIKQIRIELQKSGVSFDTSKWSAIEMYLDEQAENEAKAISYPIIKEIK